MSLIWVIKENLDWRKSIKPNTILIQKFKKEKQWVKNSVNTLHAFYYIDRTLIVLSGTSGRVSIISFASVIGVHAGIASTGFTLVFSLTTRIIKKVLKITRKKKRNTIKFLCFLTAN